MTDVFIGDIDVLLTSFFENNKFTSIHVIVDENTKSYCYPQIKNVLPEHYLIEISSGEINKNLNTCKQVWESLTVEQSDRKTLIINLGGGVICDLGGFCASTYKRGVSFLNIPTTLLAMVDAAIGGKTGIDFNGYKNQIGVFNEPEAIFVDKSFLKTLDNRQIRSGLAEMLKHAIISDIELEKIERAAQNFQLTDELIREAIHFKKTVVEKDFYEEHYRKSLNFGHTIGHAIESYFLKTDEQLLHGEAILIGMICELYLSKEKLGLKEEEFQLLVNVIDRIFRFRQFSINEIDAIAQWACQDKKNVSKEIKCVLIETVGSPKIDVIISENEIKTTLQFYNMII